MLPASHKPAGTWPPAHAVPPPSAARLPPSPRPGAPYTRGAGGGGYTRSRLTPAPSQGPAWKQPACRSPSRGRCLPESPEGAKRPPGTGGSALPVPAWRRLSLRWPPVQDAARAAEGSARARDLGRARARRGGARLRRLGRGSSHVAGERSGAGPRRVTVRRGRRRRGWVRSAARGCGAALAAAAAEQLSEAVRLQGNKTGKG